MNTKEKINILTNIVCNYLEVPVNVLKTRARKRNIVEARQIICYQLITHNKDFKLTLHAIGSLFISKDYLKGFHHSTVLYAKKTISNLIDTKAKLSVGILASKVVEDTWIEYRRIIMGYSREGLKQFINTFVTIKYRNNQEIATITGTITSLGSKAFLIEKEELKIPLSYEQIINIKLTIK